MEVTQKDIDLAAVRNGGNLLMFRCRGLLWIALLMGMLVSCSDSFRLVSPVPTGAYRYTSYDTAGRVRVLGWLTLQPQDSTQVHGEWHMVNTGGLQDLGPQVGSGTLMGWTQQTDSLSVNLNPHVNDHNVILIGSWTDDAFRGEWHWNTIAGPTSRGTFEAIRE